MPTTDRKLRVFLCHASQDKAIVRELYQRLLAEGWIDPWLDEEKLIPGQDWGMEIEKAVEAADTVIVCISNNSVTKEGYVQKEVRKVLDVSDEKPEGTIFVIPVRIDDVQIPRRLKMWQYVDFFPVNQKGLSYIKLMTSLRKRAREVFAHAQMTEYLNKKFYTYTKLHATKSLAWILGIQLFFFFLTFLIYDVYSDSSNLPAVPVGSNFFLWFFYGFNGVGGWIVFSVVAQISIFIMVYHSVKNHLRAFGFQVGIVLVANLILPSFLYRITTDSEGVSLLYPFSETIFFLEYLVEYYLLFF